MIIHMHARMRAHTRNLPFTASPDGLELPPPVAKLCLSRMAALTEEVKGVPHNTDIAVDCTVYMYVQAYSMYVPDGWMDADVC